MTRERRNDPVGDQSSPQSLSLPFGAVWSAFTSEFGDPFTDEVTATGTSDSFATSSVPQAMPSTAAVMVPISTVTVESTFLMTSWVTVQITGNLPRPSQTTPTTHAPSSTTSSSAISGLPSPSQAQQSSAQSSSQNATLPAAIAPSSSAGSASVTVSLRTQWPVSTPSVTTTSVASLSNPAQKHVIVGGLSGTIAGLLMIGILLYFCLRRRRRREEEGPESMNEKGIRPAIARKWTEITVSKGTPKPMPHPPPSSSPVSVDEDHHIIRMSLNHWSRPFAQGQGEGFRESVAPGQLRVVNPDLSRPTTPRMSSDTAGGFLRRQRSALAAVLLNGNQSRASSRSTAHAPQQIAELTIDPALSRECVATMATTPSFKSYPSVTTLPFVQQQPPEDPFLTPSMETAPPTEMQRPRRPSLATLQNAAGRTLSHLGSTLNPFRTKSNLADSLGTFSRHSVSSFSSRLSRQTGVSDPFDLDKPSIRGSHGVHGRIASEIERQAAPNWSVYDGT